MEEVKEVLHFLESDKHSLVKRLMLDNMTKLDPSAPGTHCWLACMATACLLQLLFSVTNETSVSLML